MSDCYLSEFLQAREAAVSKAEEAVQTRESELASAHEKVKQECDRCDVCSITVPNPCHMSQPTYNLRSQPIVPECKVEKAVPFLGPPKHTAKEMASPIHHATSEQL